MPEPGSDPEDIIDLTHDSEPEDYRGPVASTSRNGRRGGQDGPPLSATARQQLYTAIAACPEEKLREVVANLVAGDSVSSEALLRNLVVEKQRSDSPPAFAQAPPAATAAAAAPVPPRRVLIPRWETCRRCDENLDVGEERVDGECVCHPGSLEVNYNKFVDWDEDVHGPEDTPANRRDFPDHFTWTCCGEDGTSQRGCTEAVHIAGSSKRRFRH